MKSVVAAAIQSGSVPYDTPQTLEKFEDLCADAARKGANFQVFPEAFIGGYPKEADFGAKIGLRTPTGRQWYARYHQGAIVVPGPETDRMGSAARSAQATVVVGIIERSLPNCGAGTLFCSILIFSAAGHIIGHHRKLMPTASERTIWGMGDGSSLRAVETPIGRVGALICWENLMPQARLALYAQGVELWAAPTVDDRETWLPLMQTVAMEGRCFVVSACQHLRRSEHPLDDPTHAGKDPEDILIRGGSVIIDPLGRPLCQRSFNEDNVLIAHLDAEAIPQAKYDFDVVGHYARADIFQLRVRPQHDGIVQFEE